MSFLTSLFSGRSSLFKLAPLSQEELVEQVKGKRFLIVGGTKGIGAALAQSLVQRGAEVVVTGRSKSEETPEKAEFVKSDVSSVNNAHELVSKQLRDQKFDTAIMTVGIITRSELTRTADGIEEDLAVSYLSRFVIANELIRADALEGRKRIFIMGYPGQDIKPVNSDDINFEHTPYKQFGAHMNTVLFNDALVYELAHRHPDLHVFGLNPGLIRTGIRDNVHGGATSIYGKIVESLIDWTNPSANWYAENCLVHMLASPELDSKSGMAFSRKMDELPPGPWVAEQGNREKVWKASQDLVSRVVSTIIAY